MRLREVSNQKRGKLQVISSKLKVLFEKSGNVISFDINQYKKIYKDGFIAE